MNVKQTAALTLGAAALVVTATTSAMSEMTYCEHPKWTAPGYARAGDYVGYDVSIDGPWAVAAALRDDGADPDNEACYSGAVYVYRQEGSGWVLHQKCVADEASCGDALGHAVSISGDYFAVGANGDSDHGGASGAAYVFRRDSNGTPDDLGDDLWVQAAKLTADDAAPGDQFGFVVAISGENVVVGSVLDDDVGSYSGSAYIFRLDDQGTPTDPTDDAWVQQAKLLPADLSAGDEFGVAVSISGNHAVVGSWWDDDAGSRSGSAYVFVRDNSGTPDEPGDDAWVEQAKLTASDAASGDEFGGHLHGISISGDYAVIGASKDDDAGSSSGSAYVFRRDDLGTPDDPDDDTWTEVAKLTASDAAPGDMFGQAVAIHGRCVAIGTYSDNGPVPGWIYLFCRDDNGTPADPDDDTWVEEVTRFTASEAAAGDKFGAAVALDDISLIAGAYLDDDEGDASGSASVFTVSGPDCNTNGAPDTCDILDGISEDANSDGIPDECEEAALCDYLGDSCWPGMRDIDLYTFEGSAGEDVTVSLDRADGDDAGYERATLVLMSWPCTSRPCRQFRMDRSALPNQVSATLPCDGRYLVLVKEQPAWMPGEQFTGDYCLTMDASGDAASTFEGLHHGAGHHAPGAAEYTSADGTGITRIPVDTESGLAGDRRLQGAARPSPAGREGDDLDLDGNGRVDLSDLEALVAMLTER